MFALPTATVIAAQTLTALSKSSIISLILEQDRSFRGSIQISSEPMLDALNPFAK